MTELAWTPAWAVHPAEPPAAPLADPRTLPPATGYAYLLPGGWVDLEVAPGRRAASVRRAVAQRVRREPRLIPHRAQLQRLLLVECATAGAAGVERVSLFAEPVGGRAMTAALTMVVHTLTPPAEPLDGAGILARLGESAGRVGLVELSQIQAVRRTWEGSRAGPAGPLPVRQWQLLVPFPGRAQIGLLTMASSCRPLWPLLEPTFDACAQTFHWTWSIQAPAPAPTPPRVQERPP